MYTFSSKLKTFSFILMLLGALGIGYGFLTAPKDIQEVEKILAAESHGSHHAEAVGTAHEAKPATAAAEVGAEPHGTIVETKGLDSMHVDTIAVAGAHTTTAAVNHDQADTAVHKVKAETPDAHAEHQAHLEHVLHQLQNKPWAALYVACIFFMLISLGVLAFYAIQQVAQAGWSPVLFRVMQGITAYLPVGSVIFFIILVQRLVLNWCSWRKVPLMSIKKIERGMLI